MSYNFYVTFMIGCQRSANMMEIKVWGQSLKKMQKNLFGAALCSTEATVNDLSKMDQHGDSSVFQPQYNAKLSVVTFATYLRINTNGPSAKKEEAATVACFKAILRTG
jgi:hypothetical protein